MKMKSFVVASCLGSALVSSADSIRWFDGSWDASPRPMGKLLSDNPRWFGERIFTGVTYTWQTPPTFPRDIRGHNGPPAQRLIGGATRIIEWDTVGGPGDKPLVAVFDFKRPCSFTEIDFVSERCTNAFAEVSFSADGKSWGEIQRREVVSALTRLRLAAPQAGRYMKLQFQAKPEAVNTWWKKTRGYTFLDEVLVWGDGEVSSRYPENVDSTELGNALTFTNVAPNCISILPMPIPHLARKPSGATPANLTLAVARNETESRYFAIVNGSDKPATLAIRPPDFGPATKAEILISGVLRMSPPKRKLSDTEMVQLHTNDRNGINKGNVEDLDVLPFFFPHTTLPANQMRHYLANSEQISRFPEAVTLRAREGCVVMLRITTDNAQPGSRSGVFVAGDGRLPIRLDVVNLTLPRQNMWIYAYEPFTQQFPFESRARVKRDAERYLGVGATTTRHLPERGSKEEIFFKAADNPSVGHYLEGQPRSAGAFKKVLNGKFDSLSDAEKSSLVDDAREIANRAKALGLAAKDLVLFLPDEPGPNNAKSVMSLARLLKTSIPEIRLHCDPLFYKGGSGFCSNDEIISLLGKDYNELIDVSCPIGYISSRPRLLEALWARPRFINAQYQHPAGRTGRGFAYSCHRNRFNGFAYYCYYHPNGKDPWDIRTWGVLNYDYQAVFPLEEDVALTPLYEFLREGAEENRLLEALKASGKKDLYGNVLKRSATAWDRTHFLYKYMNEKGEDILALREDILRAFR